MPPTSAPGSAREGDHYVINGRKWFITGAADPRCRICILMGVTDPDARAARAPLHGAGADGRRPASTVVRNLPIMHHTAPEGHCEMRFDDVRVPVANLLGEEGKGFALAQARLGPGRIHHCMRSIGQCELALELMCARAARARDVRPEAARARHGRRVDRALAHGDRPGAASGAARRLADRPARQPGRAQRRRDDQGRGAAPADHGAVARDAGLRRDGPDARHAARFPVELGPRAAVHRRPGRGASAHASRAHEMRAPGGQPRRRRRAI